MPGLDCVEVDLARLVDDFPGPACVVDGSRSIVRSNHLWADLIRCEDGNCLPAAVLAHLLSVRAKGYPDRVRTSVVGAGASGNAAVSYEFTLLPLHAGRSDLVVVLGNDLEDIRTLTDALIQSRDFHRDLTLCSSDMVFEADAAGRITYSGLNGFLGYTESELLGRPASDLVAADSANPADLIFSTREPIHDVEVRFVTATSATALHIVSVMPVTGVDDDWRGVRGVGRDVTEMRIREDEVARMRRARLLIDQAVHAIRSEIHPAGMLSAAVATAIDTAGLVACAVLEFDVESGADAEIVAVADVRNDDERRTGLQITTGLVAAYREDLSAEPALGARRFDRGGQGVVIVPSRHDGLVNGALICLLQKDDSGQGDPGSPSLKESPVLRAIAEQAGFALAQRLLFPEVAEHRRQ